ncbi:MAG: PilZ domain-containing protein [Tepidisphaeraceae bacterium]
MVAMLKMTHRFEAEEETGGAERRIFPRREVHGHVESRRVDHSIEAQRNPRLSLTLRDLSLGGLSAISDVPVRRGERLAVFFPPQGATRGWDAAGRVIRCQPSGTGYRVALEFDPLPMAA